MNTRVLHSSSLKFFCNKRVVENLKKFDFDWGIGNGRSYMSFAPRDGIENCLLVENDDAVECFNNRENASTKRNWDQKKSTSRVDLGMP